MTGEQTTVARPPHNLAVALAHAAAGRRVFPCDPATKRPSIAKSAGGQGFKDATTEEAKIRAWWASYPDAIVGMPTGARTGVWVLDVDVKEGKLGEETLATLVETFGRLPDTIEALTATGGRHIYFRHPRDGRLVPSRASRLGSGLETWGQGGYPSVPFARAASGQLITPDLDVRGDGGYVILPGSRMRDGREYTWEGSSDPDEGVAVAIAPDWLLALVCADLTASGGGAEGSDGSVVPIAEGARNDTLYRLGCSLRAKGLSESAIIAALLAENAERCRPPLSEAEVRATAKSAASKPPGLSPAYAERRRAQAEAHTPPPAAPPSPGSSETPPPGRPRLRVVGGTEHDPRPVIQVRNGELPEAVDDAEHYLIASGSEVFTHGTRLVRVGRWESDTGGPVTRPQGTGVLIDISPEWLTDTLTRVIRWERFDPRKGEMKRVDCPSKISSTLLARVGSWSFPPLVGFCDSPTLDRQGRLIDRPGYDPQSGLYISHPPPLAPITVTDRHLAERGAEVLSEAVSTFPFVSPADESACLSLIMTALLRRSLPAAPLGGISASTAGTGKSKLVDVIAAIATGRPAPVVGIGSTPEELEKRVDSLLLKGDTLATFDNIDRALKSDTLCQISTQASKSIRVMGLSKIVEAPTNVMICMTGNNLTLLGDLVRRCVIVHLDAQCERPETRQFARDAVEYVLGCRGELIRAALMISKAYLDAGCPEVPAAPFGSFEVWDRMVRRPLLWAGYPDPLRPAEAMREQDHELIGMRELMREWRFVHSSPITAADLLELIRARVGFGGDWEWKHPQIYDAATQVFGDLSKITARDLGYRLRAMQGRIVDGRRIVKAEKSRKGLAWLVEEIDLGRAPSA